MDRNDRVAGIMSKLITIGLILFSFAASAQSDWPSKIIEEARRVYEPVSWSSFGKPIHFVNVDNINVAASAEHDFKELKVVINSGLLTSPRLTPDSLRMILCHELGHLFGGAPRRNIPMEWEGPIADDNLSFMSSEGQADYYAGLSCFKNLVKEAEGSNIEQADRNRVGPVLKAFCQEDQLCLRSALAGLDFLRLTYDFPISCEERDDTETPELIRDSYPARQCRLDTIMNASACGDQSPLMLDFSNASVNTCTQSELARPICWYK